MNTTFIQNTLFDQMHDDSVNKIPGLSYFPNFITQSEEEFLLHIIDAQVWLGDLKRRVQHYGYKYDYAARRVSNDLKLGKLPSWVKDAANMLYSRSILAKMPDQVIVNEYKPGQGISPHIDCIPCFEDGIASLSLGSPCAMDFIHKQNQQKISILLEPRSLVVLKGDARFLWQHGIASRKTDYYNGTKFIRERRVSMTFRNVIIEI